MLFVRFAIKICLYRYKEYIYQTEKGLCSMSKKAIKIWLIVILAVTLLAGLKYILSQNLKDEALFDIDPEKVEYVELYKAGSELLTTDDEKQSEII